MRARWCVNILYAVIAQTMADVKLEHERAQRREDSRPKPFIRSTQDGAAETLVYGDVR